jgi:hypothetical protein
MKRAAGLILKDIFNSVIKHLWIFGFPQVEEDQRVSLALSNRFDATEKALTDFSNAIELYARHLASHTSAIQGLSEASQSLKGITAEQNRVLHQMTRVFVQQRTRQEFSRIQEVVDDFEKRTRDALQAKNELEKEIPAQRLQISTALPVKDNAPDALLVKNDLEKEIPVQKPKTDTEQIIVVKVPHILQVKNELEKVDPAPKPQTNAEPRMSPQIPSSPQGCTVKPKALLAKNHFHSKKG